MPVQNTPRLMRSAHNGKVVAKIVRDDDGALVLEKTRVRPEWQYRNPPGWGFEVDHLHEAKADGVQLVRLVEVDGTYWDVPIDDFMKYSVFRDHGYGPQRILPLRYWRRRSSPQRASPPSARKPAVRQLSLTLGTLA